MAASHLSARMHGIFRRCAISSSTDHNPAHPALNASDTPPARSSSVEETSTGPSETGAAREISFGPPIIPNEIGTLGPYRVVRQLGRGGMGAVYLAVDTRLNRKLALKVMLPQYAADAIARERFLREAQAAGQVAHDNVVTVYEADERNGVTYIAMQFLQGYALDEYLRRKGRPGISQVIRLAREAAAGLAAAHKIGLVHRDIKPANLWLEAPNGRVKVLDFGLAKPLDTQVEMTRSGVIMGTPAYMSPEQGRGVKVDARTDLFSLGAVLYQLCTGRVPFEGPNIMAVLTALATEDPRPVQDLNPAVPGALADLIQQMLAKKPDDRPATADEVVRRLRAIAEELSLRTSAQRSGPSPLLVTVVQKSDPSGGLAITPQPVPRTAARHRSFRQWAPALVLATTVLIATVVGISLMWKQDRNTTQNGSPHQAAGASQDSKPANTASPDTEAASKASMANEGSAPAADPDRVAANWVLYLGGTVQVNGEKRIVAAGANLPSDPFALTTATLSDLRVTDTDLARFKELRGLQSLILQGTAITDVGLTHLEGLASLKILNLSGTAVTDEGLAHLRGLTGLTELWLKGTRFTNSGLQHIRHLTELQFLTVAGTGVTDAGLAQIKMFQNLAGLGLDGTAITDAGAVSLSDLKNLTMLWLNNTAVSDEGLAHLSGLSALMHVNLRRTRVTAKGVATLQAAIPACMVEFDEALDQNQ